MADKTTIAKSRKDLCSITTTSLRSLAPGSCIKVKFFTTKYSSNTATETLCIDGEDQDRHADQQVQPRAQTVALLESPALFREAPGFLGVSGQLFGFGKHAELPPEVGP